MFQLVLKQLLCDFTCGTTTTSQLRYLFPVPRFARFLAPLNLQRPVRIIANIDMPRLSTSFRVFMTQFDQVFKQQHCDNFNRDLDVSLVIVVVDTQLQSNNT